MTGDYETRRKEHHAEVLDEAIQQREAMRALLKHAGWAMLCETIDEDIGKLEPEVLGAVPNLDALLSTEHKKGSLHYAKNIKALPQLMLTIAEDTIEAYEKELSDGQSAKE